jgi:hypothetical protein
MEALSQGDPTSPRLEARADRLGCCLQVGQRSKWEARESALCVKVVYLLTVINGKGCTVDVLVNIM